MPTITGTDTANHADNKTLLLAMLADYTAIRAVLAGLLTGSATWDAGSIADGDMESKDITVTGAALGDFVLVSISIDNVDLTLTGTVTAANVVTATLANNTGGAVDLASCTVRAVVLPRASFLAPAALTVTA
jgi:hypothetical protein